MDYSEILYFVDPPWFPLVPSCGQNVNLLFAIRFWPFTCKTKDISLSCIFCIVLISQYLHSTGLNVDDTVRCITQSKHLNLYVSMLMLAFSTALVVICVYSCVWQTTWRCSWPWPSASTLSSMCWTVCALRETWEYPACLTATHCITETTSVSAITVCSRLYGETGCTHWVHWDKYLWRQSSSDWEDFCFFLTWYLI